MGVLAAVGVGVGLLTHDGYRVYIVHTGSMIPTYDPGDLLIDGPVGVLRVGEVITFRHSGLSTDVVTHRIVDLEDNVIHTKGDANRTADVWDIRPSQVQGVVIADVPRAGYALVYLRSPFGVASVVTGVLGLVLLYSLFFSPAPPRGPVGGPGRHAVPSGGRHQGVMVPGVPPAGRPRHSRDQPPWSGEG